MMSPVPLHHGSEGTAVENTQTNEPDCVREVSLQDQADAWCGVFIIKSLIHALHPLINDIVRNSLN